MQAVFSVVLTYLAGKISDQLPQVLRVIFNQALN
jgi:hypothetical protein